MNRSFDKRHPDPPIVQACYQTCLEIQRLTSRFPRRQKFLLGDSLAAVSLDLLTRFARACAARDLGDKAAQMRKASALLLPFRLQLRLARDLECVSAGQYVNLSIALDELQKQSKAFLAWAETESSGTGGGESRRLHAKQNPMMKELT